MKRINLPLTREEAKNLKMGESVLLSGSIITGRDAAHKRFYELLQKGESLPIDVKDKVIYYVGPAPAKEGNVIGPAGPTSSYRMDKYTPSLLEMGLIGMIGKGIRSDEVIESMKKNGCVYFAATGGAAALISKSVKKVNLLCYEDLGTEAVCEYIVEDFPCIVAIDSQGNNIYKNI